MISTPVETGQNFMTLPRNSNIDVKLNYRLSVQFSLTGLSFLVTNLNSNEFLFFLEIKHQNNSSPEALLLILEKTLLAHEELQENFDEVLVIYATNFYALVPTPLFDRTKASDYLKLNSKILANDFVAFDTIENNDLTIVYIPYININNYLYECYGLFKYFHASTLLLTYILNIEKHLKQDKVYLNITNSLFDIIVIKNGDLELCNSYEFKTPEDFIYYILFCLEQLKLNPDTIEFIMSGDIDKKDPNFKILYKYVRNIIFIKHKIKSVTLEDGEHKIHENLLLKLAQ